MPKKPTKKTFRICYFREKAKRKELEKILKIIKEKNIDMNVVKFCKTYSEYLVFSHLLTETEFNKLKEYFK